MYAACRLRGSCTSEVLSVSVAWPSQESIAHWKARKNLAARWRLHFRTWHVFSPPKSPYVAEHAVRCNVLVYVSDEAHRGPYVLTELHHLFLTSIIIDAEVSELMKAAGVTYP
jgi:hypothetical protein